MIGDELTGGLLEQRRVMIGGPLDAATVTATTAQLMLLDGTSADPVAVVVNSPGGLLEDAVGLLDTLKLMRTPLVVDVLGQAHGSAGVIVAGSPGTRRLGRTGSISLRLGPRPADPRQLTAEELVRLSDAASDLQRRMAAVIGTRAGLAIDDVLDQFERGPVCFGPDAIEAGLVDELR